MLIRMLTMKNEELLKNQNEQHKQFKNNLKLGKISKSTSIRSMETAFFSLASDL